MNPSDIEPPTRGGPDDSSSAPSPSIVSRRAFAGGVAAAAGISLLGGWASSTASATTALTGAGTATRGADGVGSVATAPGLPREFGKTFESRFIHANGIRQHVVIGGEGPPLLLVHGWPENWYAWRFVMPVLARDFTVIAVDQRGIGLTEKSRDGYDSGTLARDLIGVMDALGHERFAAVGHDTGYIICYALAADHRDRVDRLVVAEIPGPPGVGRDKEPTLFVPEHLNNRLWHIPFNRVDDELIVDMVSRSADAFYRYEFAIQGGGATLPEQVIKYYVDLYTRHPAALRASFGLYRAWDATIAQNEDRTMQKLTIPVLGIGGANSWGEAAGLGMTPAATDVHTVVIPGAGHWVAEQAPEHVLAALAAFLAPYLAAA